jgi:hypothetical protein
MLPQLKRVKFASVQELRDWLSKNGDRGEDVMIVTVAHRRGTEQLSRDGIAAALSEHSWRAGRAYVLNGGLHGQIIHRPDVAS